MKKFAVSLPSVQADKYKEGSAVMAISVGIDLGTTFSAVAVIDPQTKLPKIVPNREGEDYAVCYSVY